MKVPLLPKAPNNGGLVVLKPQTYNLLCDLIRRITPIAGDGLQERETLDGLLLTGSGFTARHPFEIRLGTDSGQWFIEPGTVAGIWPTIGGDPINDSPPPELIAASGDIWLEIDATPAVEDLDPGGTHDWVVTGLDTINSIIIDGGGTAPTTTLAEVGQTSGTVTDGTYIIIIGSTDGDVTITGQAIETSLALAWCPSGQFLNLLQGRT